ncbi:MAG: radical SAM protein [Dehalococcoidales bacterium]|nr:radical SAM protein [Dehalococcoidales bacterium]
MKIGLMALSGVRVRNEKLIKLGVTLPQFVSRGKVVAQLPSLSLLIIAAMTPDDIETAYIEVPDINQVKVLNTGYDLVAITSYSAQIYEAYELARRYREAGIPVVIGGLHVSAEPEEAKQYADSVVIGEAELLWPRVIDDFRNNRLQPIYKEEHPGNYAMADSPMPRYELLQPKNYNRMTVQTSRGCPHECEFCSGSKLFGSGFRQKPVDRVIEEIKGIKEIWPKPFIEFADDNTFADKKWSKEFLDKLIPLDIRWFAETDISVADDEDLLKAMYHSGCYQLLIGLESTSEDSLNGIEAHNWKLKRRDGYMAAIDKIQSNGIAVNGCFIVGLDGDTPGIFEDIRAFIDKSRLLEAQVTVLTPYPGSPVYKRLKSEGRLLKDKFWDRCTMFDINFTPRNMSMEELENGLLWIFGEIYTEQEYLKRKRHYMDIVKKLPKRGQQ